MTKNEQQRQAWRLRQEFNWPLHRIARRLGVGRPAVSRLLARAQTERNALMPPAAFRPPERRWVRPLSLSLFHL